MLALSSALHNETASSMNDTVQLCLVLHNHQPIGNFDGVIEQAYQDSYLPFLEVFESYEDLRISLHTSGPLMRWLVEHHPEYIQRITQLVAADRIEIIGGPFYEPILPMLPSRDRVGQIRTYAEYLEKLFSKNGQSRHQNLVKGMWMPERVWETSLTADIVQAGIAYTVLDDYHFKAAGWSEESLRGYYITEDDGQLLRVFPGSEKLRYLIPFAAPEKTIEYLAQVARQEPGAVLVFGDDGEKFGTWPDTKEHVYARGWLRKFFDALTHNQSWLRTRRLSDVVADTAPAGKIYLPDCSYREMTEWAMPVAQQQMHDELTHALHDHPQWADINRLIRGGNWRNFKVRYTETNEMYARMMAISSRLEEARHRGYSESKLEIIQDHLYRGQCNCPYWHGAFGGVYLPHLRNAIYQELIKAENLLDDLEQSKATFVEATSADYDFDLRSEVRLANDHFVAFVAPAQGGMLYELDVRGANHNLLATLQRRPESYHRKVLRGNVQSEGEVASIHDRVVFKQEGLDRRLQYDQFPRKSFLEHFYDNDLTLDRLVRGEAMERGDFVAMPFEAKLRRSASKVQLQLSRDGNAWGIPLRITKTITLEAGSPLVSMAYLVEGLPRDRQLHLALEWNFAGLPSGADDRYFYNAQGKHLGHLGSCLNLANINHLGLIDQWLGVDVLVGLSRPATIWTYPIETVSQSEAGFELVHQSVCVMPHWLVQGDNEGKWSVQMQMRITAAHRPCVLSQQKTQCLVMAPM
jgi:4-alpha-glucanotransferase